MTSMIYRGFPIVEAQEKLARMAGQMIYRGQSHDGLTSGAAPRTTARRMSYRAVPYTLTTSGEIALENSPTPLTLAAVLPY